MAHRKRQNKLVSAQQNKLVSAPTCNACCSIGCPQLCELKAGHKGKHRKTGDAGKPGKSVKFILTWTGNFYDVFKQKNGPI